MPHLAEVHPDELVLENNYEQLTLYGLDAAQIAHQLSKPRPTFRGEQPQFARSLSRRRHVGGRGGPSGRRWGWG